jgi:branched-chain amino acid transport system permease protein
MVIALILSSNFKHSAIGRACISVNEDEIAAEAMGINTTKYKVIAFIFGAVLASIAGALFATTYYVVKPETFGVNTSINILIIVVFGGMGSLTGTVLATIFIGIVFDIRKKRCEFFHKLGRARKKWRDDSNFHKNSF